MVEASSRMKALMNDLVLEARRSGYIMAELRYESELWNDEHDKLYAVLTHSDRFKEIYAKEV